MDTVVVEVAAPGQCPEPEELLALYDAVGWTVYTRDLAVLVDGIKRSQRVVTARRHGRLVGLARIITDGATICYLQDVLVEPGQQRAGIGRLLVDEAFAPYARVRQHVLVTDEEQGQKAFYESLGFRQLGIADMPGRAFMRVS